MHVPSAFSFFHFSFPQLLLWRWVLCVPCTLLLGPFSCGYCCAQSDSQTPGAGGGVPVAHSSLGFLSRVGLQIWWAHPVQAQFTAGGEGVRSAVCTLLAWSLSPCLAGVMAGPAPRPGRQSVLGRAASERLPAGSDRGLLPSSCVLWG